METNVFATKTIQGSPVTGTGVTALAGKGGMFSGTAGLNFMDLIMAQLQANGDLVSTSTLPAGVTNTLNTQSADIAGTPENIEKLAQQALAALGKATQQAADGEQAANANADLGLVILSPQDQKKLLAILQNFLNGQPEGSKLTVESLNNGILKKLDTTDLVSAKEEGDPTLIVSGLSPQQLTDLLKKLQEGKDDPTQTDLMVGIVQLTAPEIKKEAFFPLRGSLVPATPVDTTPSIAGQSIEAANIETSGLNPLTTEASKEKGKGFGEVLKLFESAKGEGTNGKLSAHAELKAQIKANGPVNATLPATPQTTPGTLTQSVSWDQIYPEGLSLQSGMTGTMVTNPITGVAQMTSLTSGAPAAVTPHPATQQVASALTRSINGTESALTLRLDPPDLGKVSIRMVFGKNDKTVKAVVTAEKPETFMMLQRDSHVLERSLQDAGLDTANGLTFQLSQDGSLMGQNQQGQKQTYDVGPSGQAEEEIAIETTMNWSVDPRTGTMHYNVLA
jgi:flagellar hook-length control protein FliK